MSLTLGVADAVLADIQRNLLKNPERGDVVPGLGGIRKARISDPSRGKGKRSGFRYMFLHLERRSHIHLLFLFAKNEKEDLDAEERAFLRELVAEIKHEGETGWPRKRPR